MNGHGYIVEWRLDRIEFDGEKNGKLIETYIFNELSSIIDSNPAEYELYHYRYREQQEVDLIIEKSEGDPLGIEVKSGTAINNEHFKHLKWFKQNLARDKHFIGIVFYFGPHIVSFGEGLWAVPSCCLWG